MTSYCGTFSALQALRAFSISWVRIRIRDRDRDPDLDLDRAQNLDQALDQALGQSLDLKRERARALARSMAQDRALSLAQERARDLARVLARARLRYRDRDPDRILTKVIDQAIGNIALHGNLEDLRRQLWRESKFLGATIDHLATVFDLQPRPFWKEALKVSRLRELPRSQPLLEPAVWRGNLKSLLSGGAGEQPIWQAAAQLFMDGVAVHLRLSPV